MRLIDADALSEWLLAKIRECNMLKAYSERAITYEISQYVKNMPIIDAIPVEWLREKMKLAANAGDLDSLELLEWIEMKWHEEQEARA